LMTLIFDLDDTLVVEEASAEAAFHTTCLWAQGCVGIDPGALYKSIRESCREFWRNSPARPYCLEVGISSWEGLWAEFQGDDKHLGMLAEWAPTYRRNAWREALRRCGVEGNDVIVEELSDRFIQERRQRHFVYEDVLPVLTHFGQRCRLGLLTNGTPDLQRAKLKGSGLESFFDTVVISGEIGFGKPDLRIFELILERLDAKVESTVMVGNSLQSDISPALKLGMAAVWVNREGKVGDSSIVPDAEVTDLRKLKELLAPSSARSD
jgi:putative hydrolase of the HAD superfamily